MQPMRFASWSVAVLCVLVWGGVRDLGAQVGDGRSGASGPYFLLSSAQGREPVRVEPAHVPQLQERVTLRLGETTLGAVLDTLSARTGLRFVYSARVVPVGRPVSIDVAHVTVAEALVRVLRETDVNVVVSGNQAALVPRESTVTSVPTPGTIVGRVVQARSAVPVVGAQVLLDGSVRTFTNDEGRFRIGNVEPGRHTVEASALGYASATREVTVADGAVVEVTLELEVQPTKLADLVVTATGQRRWVELGNDITIIRADSIVATEPVASVTDLLEGRVPGLVVQRTSGAPGDPARIRLRGASSPNLSNDPIVIVDGVRVYSEQSDERGGNLADRLAAAPSPLDYIDPHSIETIHVVKGPSAATLYGQDAANGVIVITTKKGRQGPARWTVNVERGTAEIPGEYPELYMRWGRPLSDNRRVFCPVNNRIGGGSNAEPVCEPDRTVRFQLLNDPELTILDRGSSTGVSVGVSGGNAALTYGVTGSYRDEVGIVALPAYEAERYRRVQGAEPPEWLRRPQNLTQWGVSSRIQARVGSSGDVALTSMLSRTAQQRSSLERQLGVLMSTYLDKETGTYYQARGSGVISVTDDILADYYVRETATATRLTNGINLNWRPTDWWTLTADAGLDVVQREDEIFRPANALGSGASSHGALQRGQGTSLVSTLNVRARTQVPLGLGLQLGVAAGVNYTDRSISDVITHAEGLAPGTESLNGAARITAVRERRQDQATFGWYVEPHVSHRRFWLSTGLRFDGASTFGTRLKMPSFPKLSLSYLISDDSHFPESLRSVFNTLRLRAAYGQAGRQPGPTDRLRLYGAPVSEWYDGEIVSAVGLETVGNGELKPERSTEFEGGFDADMLDDRISVSFTGYRNTTKDALLDVPLAPSVYGAGVTILENVGVIRNEGIEVALTVEPVRSDFITWRALVQFSHNRNEVVALGPGVEPFYTEMNGRSGIRVAPGYPLFGRWSAPVLGYADVNGNGVLDEGEIVFGDTLVYVGGTLPEYTASIQSTVSLLRGVLSVTVGLMYEDGLTQRNEVAQQLAPFSRGWNDPRASLAEQVGVFDTSEYTWIQTVNSLRLNSLSVRLNLPTRLARRMGAQAMSLALQGTNLALWTNYSGLDPNVNARSTGNNVIDTGVLPAPRVWQLRLSATY